MVFRKVNMDVNSEEVILQMMIISLEDKVKQFKNVSEIQQNLITKIMTKLENNTQELIKYKEKYGEL
jgi:regulator of sigma D